MCPRERRSRRQCRDFQRGTIRFPQVNQLQQIIGKNDAADGHGEDEQRIEHVGMPADPVALARRDLERGIDVAARIIVPIDPFGDAQFAIQENQHVGMDELPARLPVLKPDRLEQRRDIFLGRSSD